MILGYIRCSTADQVKEDRSSLQTQTDVIEGFARTRGVDKYGVQIYTDAGVSGGVRIAKREAGAKLLQDMQKGDAVIASKLDRMFRSASDAIDTFELFKAKGVELILFDISTESIIESPIGKLIMTILAAVADMERIRIKERTAEGRKAKKARGGPIGEVPFGFKKVGEGRSATLVPNEDERRAAAVMRELFQTGHGYSDISRDLAGQGILSRAGTPFDRSAIRRELMRGIQ
jgi:DNA invertase Pin-like site-specific DNA recombinase